MIVSRARRRRAQWGGHLLHCVAALMNDIRFSIFLSDARDGDEEGSRDRDVLGVVGGCVSGVDAKTGEGGEDDAVVEVRYQVELGVRCRWNSRIIFYRGPIRGEFGVLRSSGASASMLQSRR
ncbi:uncharacterized protein EDB91DRAFT_1178527 [Suillus paluster]|uniref:uncharacterized protein n=1 Tax=Suillus paluster TaxID=48578 RepID=UPI001B862669|nr:uncharacterized protein EDB91DRAFT_1178527 [Suillus paluster]KAG1720115.1 hypothetical protein EDB91DRAFT_1178527 [Suillus paluster]